MSINDHAPAHVPASQLSNSTCGGRTRRGELERVAAGFGAADGHSQMADRLAIGDGIR
jgi:hypothetical protein